MKHKALFIGFFALGFGFFTLWQFSFGVAQGVLSGGREAAFEKLGEAVSSEDVAPLRKPAKQKIVLVFGGDVMLGRMVNYVLKQAQDYNLPFTEIKSVWQDADVVMVNLESPLAEDCPVRNDTTLTFCAETKLSQVLQGAGINLISFANNHYLDYGNTGWQATNKYLSQAGIGVVNQTEPLIREIKGKRIGFLAFNLTWNNVSSEDLLSAISQLRPAVDFLAVNYHWGEEYEDYPNEYQKRIAQLSINAGADLIIGHHPHHLQSIEEYQGKYIFYSLGNLVFDQLWSEKTRQGMLVKTEYELESGQVSYQTFQTRIEDWAEVEIVPLGGTN